MAGFRQLLMIFSMEFFNNGPVYIRGGWEGCGGVVGGGKRLNKEERRHK